MIRAVAYALGAIILIALLRGSIGLIVKTAKGLLDPPADKPVRKAGQVQCPMCGSWVNPPVPPSE